MGEPPVGCFASLLRSFLTAASSRTSFGAQDAAAGAATLDAAAGGQHASAAAVEPEPGQALARPSGQATAVIPAAAVITVAALAEAPAGVCVGGSSQHPSVHAQAAKLTGLVRQVPPPSRPKSPLKTFRLKCLLKEAKRVRMLPQCAGGSVCRAPQKTDCTWRVQSPVATSVLPLLI